MPESARPVRGNFKDANARVQNGAFLTTGGAQGLFEISADGKLRTNSGQKKDPVWKYHDRTAQSLLNEIRETAGKK